MAGQRAHHPARNPLPSRRRILHHFKENDAVMAAVIKQLVASMQLEGFRDAMRRFAMR